MKSTEEIRKEQEILEEKIRESVSEFIGKVGNCYIDIEILQDIHQYPDGTQKPILLDVISKIII
jgi:hypothetical protein